MQKLNDGIHHCDTCDIYPCHYLTPTGCSVFETRPIVCRIASCGFVRRGYIPEFITKAINGYKPII